ncbi:MAG: CPBP family intramembrane metalloprotease [Thermoplasmata archaeon]|nr:MAG: CPBP family intramembrane metalloprotease [Thermoplasmata archaeon]
MIFISVIQSTGEEVFFRGFLLRKIQEKLSGLAAILITAILFGLAHLSYGTWYQVLMPTFIGLVFGYIVIKTNNLYSSITSHITLNLVMFLIAYALKSLIL